MLFTVKNFLRRASEILEEVQKESASEDCQTLVVIEDGKTKIITSKGILIIEIPEKEKE